MTQSGVWNRWTLLAVWVVQTPVLWQSFTRPLVNIITDFEGFLGTWRNWVPYLACVACVALQFWEISSFRRRALRPGFYLGSQVFKSLVFSLSFVEYLWYFAVTWHRYLGRASWYIVEDVLGLLTLYLGLGYALYIFWSNRKSRRSISYGSYKDHYSSSQKPDGRYAAFLLPSRINSASNLVADVPWLVELVQWIYTRPDEAEIASEPLRMIPRRAVFYIRYIVGVAYALVLLPTVTTLPGRPQNPLETIRSIDWDYTKPDLASDNSQDDFVDTPSSRTIQDEESRIDVVRLHHLPPETDMSNPAHVDTGNRELAPATRLLRPRYLCFLTNTTEDLSSPRYTVRRVDEWLAENNFRGNPDYVFISYTRRQFYTQRLFDEKLPFSDLVKLKAAAERDKAILADHAVRAAQNAGILAFWVDFECVRPEDDVKEENDMEDVYRICDIVRAAHSLSIVLGPSLDQQYEHVSQDVSHKDAWILEWGMRMWTVPEALLCPSEHRVAVYTVGIAEPQLVAKRNLAGQVWEDADILRQLIDHYEGSLQLTQLELISIALECLQKRQTDPRNTGDVAYVLMGLLRLRPKVNKADSDFQAFARLSLVNDSNKILERILCLQKPGGHSPWHDMRDVWNAKLWYFDPLYHISDIGSCNTVVIGDAGGTVIDWTSLKPIDYNVARNRFRKRWMLINSTASGIYVFLLTFVFMSTVVVPVVQGIRNNGSGVSTSAYFEIYFAVILGLPLLLCCIVAICLPTWLNKQFQSSFVKTEARLFGIQGRPDLRKVEALMFGASCGRLKWSADNELGNRLDEGDNGTEYTLVDTLTCTAFSFRADKPPTLAFIGARERGVLRTLLCSYDQAARAFVKEAVIRLDGSVLQRVPRLDGFRFAIATSVYKDEVQPQDSWDDDAIEIPDIPEFRSLDVDTI